MKIVLITIKLYLPWAHSLKDKRAVAKSLLARLHNTFNVSAAETEAQDITQTLVIGVAAIVAGAAKAHSLAARIERFIQSATQAEIVGLWQEIL